MLYVAYKTIWTVNSEIWQIMKIIDSQNVRLKGWKHMSDQNENISRIGEVD